MKVSYGFAILLVMVLGVGPLAQGQVMSDVKFTLNPNGTTPLAGKVTFKTSVPAIVNLLIIDAEGNKFESAPTADPATEHDLMVLGLRPGRENSVSIRAVYPQQERSRVELHSLSVTTDPLPEDFPPLELKVSRPRRMEPGFTLIPFFRWPGAAPDNDYGLVMAVDERAEVVWYYETDHTIGDFVRLNNGNYAYQIDRNGRMVEVDMLGNIVREWHTTRIPKEVPESSIPVEADTFHHDFNVMPSGNFLALSTEVRDFEQYPSSESKADAEPKPSQVIGDTIIEFKPDGTVVNEWKVFDILDPYRVGYGSLGTGFYAQAYKDVLEKPAKDWTHTNAIFYIPEEHAVMLSSYHQDVVYKIDLNTGKLVWLLGEHGNWKEPWQKYLLTPKGENFEWQYHQHGVKLTPHGTIILFDNGTNRALPFDAKMSAEDSYSRAVEFVVDEDKMEITQVWSYGGPEEEKFFSPFICEVDWLPNKSNILVTDGGKMRGKDGKPSASIFGGHHHARVFEVTHDTPARKVFEISVDDPTMGWAIYRSERIPSLYPIVAGE